MSEPESHPNAAVIGRTIPYERFLDCVHCGLCTSACPTYVETGDENDSPRGRIYLMRSVVDGQIDLTDKVKGHLDLCLDCRSCESACPSGVQYGRLIEPFRVEMHELSTAAPTPVETTLPASSGPDWFHRWIMYGLFPNRERMARALIPARWMQRLKLDRLAQAAGLTRLLPERLRRMQEQLPPLGKRLPQLPSFLPAKGERRARIGLFLGCVADAMFRQVHWATARVLQENGCDVVIPGDQGCCGAIHYHSGASDPAVELIRQNYEAFSDDSLDAIIVNVAGCGAMLKDYTHILKEVATDSDLDPAKFVSRVKDVSEFLAELGPRAPEGPINATVAYQDACHLQHAQQIREQPRHLLLMIPGITLQPIAEAELCCGAAGSYNLTQPDMADSLGQRKVSELMKVRPDLIVTGNAGCSLQLQAQLTKAGHSVPVLHPMELLDLSYRNAPLNELT
ncbi:MAG: heterodisulfide reductase-related iron-sulfur binding cluster [Fuerstiella sp.]|jgi:glycolate oxidase iron-sulfur subunit|nr:heterodisulfide reductase-related iron-sulfur binding cluster [Fuerstiella sp.]